MVRSVWLNVLPIICLTLGCADSRWDWTTWSGERSGDRCRQERWTEGTGMSWCCAFLWKSDALWRFDHIPLSPKLCANEAKYTKLLLVVSVITVFFFCFREEMEARRRRGWKRKRCCFCSAQYNASFVFFFYFCLWYCMSMQAWIFFRLLSG